MPDVVADALSTRKETVSPIGLLATTTTLEMKLFQNAFAAAPNISVILPDKDGQEALMHAIYCIKKKEDVRSTVFNVAESLAARGARTLLLGCTDLSVLESLPLERCAVVDALDLLAERTLAEIERDARSDI